MLYIYSRESDSESLAYGERESIRGRDAYLRVSGKVHQKNFEEEDAPAEKPLYFDCSNAAGGIYHQKEQQLLHFQKINLANFIFRSATLQGEEEDRAAR